MKLFSGNALNYVFFRVDILGKKKTVGYLIENFATKTIVCKIQYPIEIFGLEEQNGDKQRATIAMQ